MQSHTNRNIYVSYNLFFMIYVHIFFFIISINYKCGYFFYYQKIKKKQNKLNKQLIH